MNDLLFILIMSWNTVSSAFTKLIWLDLTTTIIAASLSVCLFRTRWKTRRDQECLTFQELVSAGRDLRQRSWCLFWRKRWLIGSHWQKSQVRRFSDCCSADFSPNLPVNQLYNNLKIYELETFASDWWRRRRREGWGGDAAHLRRQSDFINFSRDF